MGRPVVAVHAVHVVPGKRCKLLFRALEIETRVLVHASVRVSHLDPRDLKFLPVHGDVLDLVLNDHVPVDACASAQGCASPPGLDADADLLGGILLVVPEVGDLHQLGAEELRRPMAFLARLPGGAQILDGRRDGCRVALEEHRQDLPGPRDLGLDVPGGAVADVAIHAADPRVGGSLVGLVFGPHHAMAQGSAEGDRLAVQEGIVRNEGHQDGEGRPAEDDVAEPLPLRGVVEVDPGIGKRLLGLRASAPQALAPHPVEEQDGPHAEESREDHVREDPDVGAGALEA